mgnify:CR=1 FL=1
MKCLLVEKAESGEVHREITSVSPEELPPGDVTIRVEYSSLNYKDALAAQGHPGVVSKFPHVPGIDAAGIVEQSTDARFQSGQQVLVTGYELGSGRWGGWSEQIRVPADWVVPLPSGLTALDAMTLGTAGFTAAQCVDSLQRHHVTADRGDVVVTGATGGVGSLSVIILSQLGYHVTAVSGKSDTQSWLAELGACNVIARDAVNDASDRPMLKSRWAGAVDTVGGQTLATLVRSLDHRGCVAACGLVGGTDLPLTGYPFLLRGVTLDGIDSAQCPYASRIEIRRHLAGDWKPAQLESLRTVVALEDIEASIQSILKGGITGRVVVQVASDAATGTP